MNKRILSLIIALLLCVAIAIPTFAATADQYTAFVVDEFYNLEDDEVDALNAEALEVFNKTGVGVFFVYTYDEDISREAAEYYVEGFEDYVLMIENVDYYNVYAGGSATDYINDDVVEELRGYYDEEMTYRAGVSAFISETRNLFPEKSGSDDVPESDGSLLVDSADILTDSEETALLEKLNRVTKAYNVSVAIVTVDGIGDMTIDRYINYYYDNSGLGYGVEREGVLFLIDMETRKFRILSNGGHVAAPAITDDVIADITETITSDLSDGNYADAFNTFVDECEYQINGQINGFPFKFGRNIIIALVIGLVVALIVTGSMKGKLKSVKKQDAAGSYVKQGSLMLSESRDTFLYSRVTRTEKQSSSDNNRSSGGGSSRNVGGGSF